MKEKLKPLQTGICLFLITAVFLGVLLTKFAKEENVSGAYLVETEYEERVQAKEEIVVININAASKEDLVLLPGVGEKTAGEIVAFRAENGPFEEKEDIMKVEGVSENIYWVLADLISVK